ncbi:LPXTG cell wall anchor domain-containing protein [Enterococcus casseliflavus]|nr:LPXTG cell wall anchor domain-containing protein [Enterococcus casseliflavus]
MVKKRKGWLIVALLLTFLPFTLVTATEVQQVETTGTIGFTGFYEPIGTPDPPPPGSEGEPPITDIAKPGGSLPQTNVVSQTWLIWLGISVISLVFLLWQKNKNQKKLN